MFTSTGLPGQLVLNTVKVVPVLDHVSTPVTWEPKPKLLLAVAPDSTDSGRSGPVVLAHPVRRSYVEVV